MKRVELVGLLDTMASLDCQRITAKMPLIRIEDLEAPATAADDPTEMSGSEPTSVTVRFRTPTAKSPASSAPARVVAVAGDVTLIGAICALSLVLCAALAWLA